ncbi:hypothetical protein LIX60_30840 [Streptomyces sp. S07_1.15]|uniref:hypothetical protein n=1 Tax=Streptomyces sp. S07_1.15 TaxID=2873925 RepID=UPI001D13EE3D|nr:hypothetical protein [Streptomyces sp. S07_1.15]MCC3655780.1 hypothetical protein [Streptomyces sp. S07_1.15]
MLGLVLGTTTGMWFGLIAFTIAGLPVGLMFGRTAGETAVLGTGLACGLATGVLCVLFVLSGALATESSAAKPGVIIGENVQLGLTVGLVAGLTVGMVCGLAVGLWFGLAVGLAACLAGILVGGDAAWRYLVFLMCARRRVPFRLARFLDWSCDIGLMRYSGPAYQFRHRELQLWLTTHPVPVA